MKQQKFFQMLRIVIFAVALIGGCVLGFIFSLRPTHSDAENRDLAEFPTYDATEFVNGTYTTNIGLWYSDTFPFRDTLISMNDSLRRLYGIKTQTASSDGIGDTIDTGNDFVWETDPPTSPDTSGSDKETRPVTETEPETTPPTTDHEVIKGYLVDGIHGYELYYFNHANSDRYARAIVQTALNLQGKAQVYTLVTPMPYAYEVSEQTQAELNVSNCKDAIDWLYTAIAGYGESAGLKTPIVTVDAYSALESHKDEYIFFRTDHHWTGLGAHYASRAFLDRAGRTYPALDSSAYTPCEIPDFTGSLANNTKHENQNLINNPDTLYAYVPTSVNTLTIQRKDGTEYTAPIVNPDPNRYSRSQRYLCFIDGDNPFGVIHNESVKDGSAILLIKESYGNSFAPMLVDSYEYVYIVDYRWWRTMSIEDMVDTYNIDTVLFLNYLVATSADYNIRCIEALVNVPSVQEP